MKRSVRRDQSGTKMEFVWTKVGEGGRIVLPASYRKALGLCIGDRVLLEREGDEVRVLSQDGAIRKLQEEVARYIPPDVSLVDELIADRRAEAARETMEEEEWRAKLDRGHRGGSGHRSP
jgi:AbrB family looped-hinge helix DNA binding protein